MLSFFFVLLMPSLILASPYQYVYATGDKLMLTLDPHSFVGIKDVVTLSQGGSPLNFSSINLSSPVSPRKHFVMASLQSTADYKSAFTASVEAQGSYAGISGSASAKYIQSQYFTSTTSLYMMFFETQLGDVYINDDAKLSDSAGKLLLSDPYTFAEVYGLYYIYGLTIGCQASSTVTVSAKSEQDKRSLDAVANTAYQSMFSESTDFAGLMKNQTGYVGLSVTAFVKGGNVSAIVSSIPEVKTKILDPLDTGGACSLENAMVSRALIRSWLSLQAISDLAQKNPHISMALNPNKTVLPDTLDRMNTVIMKTKLLLHKADKCSQNVFSCVTKQWNESTTARKTNYTLAAKALSTFQDSIAEITQATLTPDVALKLEQQLKDIYLKWIQPAEALSAFTFTFKIRVLCSFDHYADPPPHGTNNANAGSFTIDPNHQDTAKEISWNTQPLLDNGHHNCLHLYGHFHASFQENTLKVWQTWSRTCGGSYRSTGKDIFKPGGDTQGTSDYDQHVRTIYSFTVTYVPLTPIYSFYKDIF